MHKCYKKRKRKITKRDYLPVQEVTEYNSITQIYFNTLAQKIQYNDLGYTDFSVYPIFYDFAKALCG